LTIDIFDGDSKFFYGSCKVPLFELCRQGRGSISKPKECEIFKPDDLGNGYENGFLQIVMSNQGELSSTLNEPAKLGKQPSQSKSKRIVSNPMTYNEIQASRTLYGQNDNS